MKRFLIIVFVLAVVGGASWLIYNQLSVSPGTTAETSTTAATSRVTKGSIELLVSSTGSLAPLRQVALSFNSTGTVAEVSAQKSTHVEKGQVLAKLDTHDLETSVQQAQIALENAQITLEKVSQKPSDTKIAQAQNAVAVAQANLDELLAGPTQDQINDAKWALEQAKNSLWIAQSQRDVTRASPTANQASKAQAEVSVANAEINVQKAQLAYDELMKGASEKEILTAKNQLLQAQSALDDLLAIPSENDIKSAQNQVKLAEINLKTAQEKLDDAVLTAPFAGLLADWDLAVGDTVSAASSVGTLLDDSQYHVDISFDETEISKLAAGQPATVTLDAYPDTTLTGTVTMVDTLGTSSQGIVYYNVQVDLQPTDLELLPLMTAAVDIVAQHKDDVLLVASKAIKRDAQGTYVMVQRPSGAQRVNITIGITNGTMTEVTSGLEEGDVVLLNTSTTTSTSSVPQGGFMMGGLGR